MYILEALPMDLGKIYKIEVESFPYPYGIDILQQLINLGIGFLVAVEDETVVGYIVFWLKEEKRGHIISLAVDKKYRGRKIATQLLTKVVIIFKGVEANKITLEVRGDNEGAIEFYKKFGFLIDRKVPNYYEDGQEAYVMYFDKLVTN